MEWYRAEITGEGVYWDSGVELPEVKIVVYEFEAESDKEAEEKARRFSRSFEIRERFWMTDSNPRIAVFKCIILDTSKRERAYLKRKNTEEWL